MKNRRKKSKKWIKIGIIILILLAVVAAGTLIATKKSEEQTIGMGGPMLPTISMVVDDHTVNHLAGYTEEMDVTAMRDTITPVAATRTLQVNVNSYGEKINKIEYEAYSLNGEEQYVKNSEADWAQDMSKETQSVTLNLSRAVNDSISEAVLKIILKLDDQDVYYYTRIEQNFDRSARECLNFAKDFHNKTFDKQYADELGGYLEPNEDSDNTTLQTVNIHSNITNLQWGGLQPSVSTEVEWSIKECNTVYTSLLATYQVTREGVEDITETYNVKEFFRVRYHAGEMYLLNYSRTMDQVFDAESPVVDKDGILLGIIGEDIPYETNLKGTIVSFVQERALWSYNQKTKELSEVFRFDNLEKPDARVRNDEHAVRIISVDGEGNTTFAVYGYMSRGTYEGRVGVGVYYFNVEENVVEEKAFIPSTKSFAIAEDELGKMVYFNEKQQLLYALAGGTLYQVNMEDYKQTELATGLDEGQYVVSEDGHLIAYEANGELNTSTEITVLDLASGVSHSVKAGQDESVRPLGFMGEDFIFGHIHESDRGISVTGEEVLPMYQLEIRDSSNKTIKTYAQDGVSISDIILDKNLLTLNRLVRNDNIYTAIGPDYITNNEERKENNITLEKFSTEEKKSQMRFTFADKIKDTSVKVKKPEQVIAAKSTTIVLDDKVKADKYYVYGMGELVGIYDKAAYAIQKAEQVSGVVISSEQSYVWEKGNRDLVYSTDVVAFRRADEQSSLDSCVAFMEQYQAKRIDLTGCALNQVLYIINRGKPVIAMIDAGHAILLKGYTTESVTYIDPDTGEEHTVDVPTMEAMVARSGNTFIGYVE